jgi:peptide/nickel transport system ATP-binding protein
MVEAIRIHRRLGRVRAEAVAAEMLREVGLPGGREPLKQYPFEMSGGMRQRAMIAAALACEPELLIADEPTTALDVTIQAQVLGLLDELREEIDTSVLLITHDLGVVRQVADRVGVMYTGKIVETAPCEELFAAPLHPYTRKLLQSIPSRLGRKERLSVIPGTVPPALDLPEGCTFADRCFAAREDCRGQFPPLEEIRPGHRVACYHWQTEEEKEEPEDTAEAVEARREGSLLKLSDLKVYYPIRKGIFKRVVDHVQAVDGVNLEVRPGQTTALVGESGCGKTTLGKAVMGLEEVHEGTIHYGDLDISTVRGRAVKQLRQQIQIVFQDPYSSLNPRMRVQEIVGEGLRTHGVVRGWAARMERIGELLKMVGLTPDARTRYPHEFSGGQRQRICIARALSVDPEVLICDEATSALDVSVQAQILNLLKKLQGELGLSYLFITHDLSVVEYFADYVYVMYMGQIVEEGPTADIFDAPRHPYTKALLEAVPRVEEKTGLLKLNLEGTVPSPSDPPCGCRFHTRCPIAHEICEHKPPPTFIVENCHVKCHAYDASEKDGWA